MFATSFYCFLGCMIFCTNVLSMSSQYCSLRRKYINSELRKNRREIVRKRICQKGLLSLAFHPVELLRSTVLQRKQDAHPPLPTSSIINTNSICTYVRTYVKTYEYLLSMMFILYRLKTVIKYKLTSITEKHSFILFYVRNA